MCCNIRVHSRVPGKRVRKSRWHTQSCRTPGWGARQSLCVTQNLSERSVDNVHSFGFGSERTSIGSGRIPYVSEGTQCSQGLECSSSPTSGTVFPLVRGGFCLSVCTLTFRGSADAGCCLAAAVACSVGWRGQSRG